MKTSHIGHAAWLTSLFVVFGFMLLPLLILVAVSFNPTAMVFPPQGFTLRWYAAILDKPEFLSAAWSSTIAGVLTAVIATGCGVMAAIGLNQLGGRVRSGLQTYLLSPLFFPAVIIALSIFQLLAIMGTKTSLFVLVAAHIVVTMPYPIRNVMAQLAGFDRRLEEAALTIGATPRQALLRVTVPMMRASIAPSLVVTFILSWNNYTISIFLANPEWTTLPMQLRAYLQYEYEPFVAAMSTILILVSATLLFLVEKVFKTGQSER